jgi:hypothetical protein
VKTLATDNERVDPAQTDEPTVGVKKDVDSEPKVYIHTPESELIRGTAGKGFVGILFAFAALGVLFWIYSRLIEPYPGHTSPGEAAAKAMAETKSASTESLPDTSKTIDTDKPVTKETTGTSGKSDLFKGHDMSKMAPGTTMSSSGSVVSGFEACVASFTEDKCPVCGMTPSKSGAMVAATIDSKWLGFDSFSCFFNYSKDRKASEVEVLDYTTRSKGDAYKKMIKASEAFYLVGLDGPVSGSMPPGIPAFSTEADAKAATGDLGGRVVRFDEMKSFVESEN